MVLTRGYHWDHLKIGSPLAFKGTEGDGVMTRARA